MGHWLWVHLGIAGTGPWYAFESGSGSDIGELGILGTAIGIFRHQNCHVKGCWRLGHPLPTGDRTCHKHHPDGPRSGRNVPLHEIKARYEAHQAAHRKAG